VLGRTSNLIYGGAVLLSLKVRRVTLFLVGGGIAAALVLSGLPNVAFFALADKLLCDHIVTDFPSPTGRYISSYDIALCGGAAGAVYHDVNLRRARDPFWVEPTRLFTTGSRGDQRIEWLDGETLLIEHRAERYTVGPEELDGVRITYRRVTGSATSDQAGGRSDEPVSAAE
jgi:hypothetical protein